MCCRASNARNQLSVDTQVILIVVRCFPSTTYPFGVVAFVFVSRSGKWSLISMAHLADKEVSSPFDSQMTCSVYPDGRWRQRRFVAVLGMLELSSLLIPK